MKPNLDRRGRWVRGISGLVCIGVGGVLIITGWPADPRVWWLCTCGAFAIGAFQLFEAKKSWCIVRACGIRTPL